MPSTSSAASSCMCCPKASCASAATACCPTASANNCCLWRAPCLPNKGANRCLCHLCLIACPGTVHAAENPCASSSVSPLLNCFQRIRFFMNCVANSRCRLAPCTSVPQCARSDQNPSMATLNRILKTPDRTSPSQQLTLIHPQRRKTRPKNLSPQVRKSIIPSRITATGATAPSFLPPNRKGLATQFTLTTLSCARPFRCRLAVMLPTPSITDA